MLLKKWNKFERVYLYISLSSIIIVSIIFKSDILTTVCSIIGIIVVLLIAKGKNLGQVLGIILTVMYSIVSFKNKYYGEVIIYIFFMLPMFIVGIISWIRHHHIETNSVEINALSKKEWIIILLIIPVLFVGIYFVLKLFNTNEIILSTMSALSCLMGIYLQIRRTRSSFIVYGINDISLILLWGMPLIHGNYTIFPIFLNAIFLFIDDIYGVYNWKKIMKLQKI